jgi:hypothetical protein
MMLEEDLAEVSQRESRVQYIFDDENVLAFDGLIQILDELDGALGSAAALGIAFDSNEVKGRVDVDTASQVREERSCALEHANHDQLFSCQIFGDLLTDLTDAFGDLIAG